MYKEFSYKIRIYYEDTDYAGVVYYANYLKFAERARTEMIRELGFDQSELAVSNNLFFIVKKVSVDYKSSCSLDDEIVVKTNILKINGASILLEQQIFLDDKLITDIDVLIVSVNDKNRIVKLPEIIKKGLLL
ncbi:MAG: tol-pal system-associated acyl-CoA thioesterase [Rickettsiales bacterium]|nr:tol-pal system-associated acyl-CoA thioesterase [Rickettsiales bacterium]